MSTDIERIKNKITQWFHEEGFNPREIADLKAHFNIVITVANRPLNIVQYVGKRDSFFVETNLVFTGNALAALKQLTEEKKQAYFWDLRMELLKKPDLGEFQIEPKAPNDVREIFISSSPVFYDAVTKDRVISSIHTVVKACIMIMWKLEEISGERLEPITAGLPRSDVLL